MRVASLVEIDAPVLVFGGAAAGGCSFNTWRAVFAGLIAFGYVNNDSMVPMRQTATAVGKRIAAAREAARMRQSTLAEELGKTQATLSQWESGKRAPGIEDLMQIAATLDVTLTDLLPPPPTRKPAPVLMRAVLDSLDLVDVRAALDEFLKDAEQLPALPKIIEVAGDRPLRTAQQLLARAQLAEPDVVEPPVDIKALANLCGVQVVERDFPEDISGLLIELEAGPVIGIHLWQNEGRQRFTIAHELGHHLLGHHDRFHLDLAAPSSGEGDDPLYDWRLEREANDFAANLLMPASLVREAYKAAPTTNMIAKRFGVSPLAMGYRLVDLGLRTPQ
jgi:transcriptional regulator with XRE-family HTH domain